MAGRPRSIDRDKVLDAAEAIVIQVGAAGLTFEAVAKAAGITKGGVQYCFGTKENLIRAMITRWGDAFEDRVLERAGPSPTPRSMIQGHVSVTRDEDDTDHSRSAVIMTALLEAPDQVAETRAWYNSRLAGLDMENTDDRRTALAFLAAEGAFFLKAFGLIDLSEDDWKLLFEDMVELADDG